VLTRQRCAVALCAHAYRMNHPNTKVNFPEDLIAPFALFELFFSQALVKLMIISTNEYA
jgi:hypothetical protein